MQGLNRKLASYSRTWKSLDISDKISLSILVMSLFIFPASIILAINPVNLFSRASINVATPITPPDNNYNPKIVTEKLQPAKVGNKYKATIEGYDLDIGESLLMSVYGLPQGIEVGSCEQRLQPLGRFGRGKATFIKCEISGVPQVAGVSKVYILLKDARSQSDSQVIDLAVKESNRR